MNAGRAPEDVKAPPASAKTTASGLAVRVLRQGTADAIRTEQPGDGALHGWTTDGKRFDSSVVRGEPITFRWTCDSGVDRRRALMVEGEKTRFWIPRSWLQSAERAFRQLVFDVELITIGPSK